LKKAIEIQNFQKVLSFQRDEFAKSGSVDASMIESARRSIAKSFVRLRQALIRE
jgi:hypothetical protein